MRQSAATLILALLLAAPRVAHACSVCFSATDQARIAFIATTVFLSLLPMALVGGLVLWVRRRAAELRRLEERSSSR